jgi:hypothetical protein
MLKRVLMSLFLFAIFSGMPVLAQRTTFLAYRISGVPTLTIPVQYSLVAGLDSIRLHFTVEAAEIDMQLAVKDFNRLKLEQVLTQGKVLDAVGAAMASATTKQLESLGRQAPAGTTATIDVRYSYHGDAKDALKIEVSQRTQGADDYSLRHGEVVLSGTSEAVGKVTASPFLDVLNVLYTDLATSLSQTIDAYLEDTIPGKVLESAAARERQNLGTIAVRDRKINVYEGNDADWFPRDNTGKGGQPIGSFSIDSVFIEFLDGSITDITAIGRFTLGPSGKNDKTQERMMSFHNRIPIPLYTSNHIADFNTPGSYSLEGEHLFLSENGPPAGTREVIAVINLGDLLFYNRYAVENGNYVPDNGVIRIKADAATAVPVFRRSIADNFDVRFYTDAFGLQKDNPNGAVQAEARFNITLNSRRITPRVSQGIAIASGVSLLAGAFGHQVFKNMTSDHRAIAAGASLPLLLIALNPTFLAHAITPFVGFSRIEDKTDLQPDFTLVNETVDGVRTKVFDVRRYSNLMVGFDFTLAKTVWSSANLDVRFNLAGGFIRTPIDFTAIDTVQKTAAPLQALVSWYASPEVVFRYIHSDQIEYDLRYGLEYVDPVASSFGANLPGTQYLRNGTFLHRFQSNFNLFTERQNRDSWVFLRVTILKGGSDINQSLQIGYASSLAKLFGLTAKEKQ